MKDELIVGAIATSGASLGSITVASIPVAVTSTVSAGGLAGLLGFTTTVTTVVSAPITAPVGGIIAAGALLTYGGVKAYQFLKGEEAGKKTNEPGKTA